MPKLGEVASPLVLRQESAWIGLQATNCSDVGGTQQAIYSFDLDAGGSVTGAGVLSDFSPGRGPDRNSTPFTITTEGLEHLAEFRIHFLTTYAEEPEVDRACALV